MELREPVAVILVTGKYQMPRFFFHLRSAHKSLLDCQGMVLADAEAARQEAALAVQDFFQPAAGRVDPEWEDWSVDVRDERGRCVCSRSFADAAEEIASSARADQPASARIVYLEVARAKRELSSVENRTRNLVRRTSMLVDRNRYEAKSLYCLMRAAEEARLRSHELLARSRRQTAVGDWCVTDNGGIELH